MKVLKNNMSQNNNYIKPYPRKLICDQCGSELEYEEDDMYMGWLGKMYLQCPVCKNENMLDDNENSIELTKNNIKYPLHFLRTNQNIRNVSHITDEHIEKEIKRGIEWFRMNKSEYIWYTEYGDLFIIIFRLDGDENYHVTITRDWYETDINFEENDW